jgi:hypothetical protein
MTYMVYMVYMVYTRVRVFWVRVGKSTLTKGSLIIPLPADIHKLTNIFINVRGQIRADTPNMYTNYTMYTKPAKQTRTESFATLICCTALGGGMSKSRPSF